MTACLDEVQELLIVKVGGTYNYHWYLKGKVLTPSRF
jgi:hypothetical protein